MAHPPLEPPPSSGGFFFLYIESLRHNSEHDESYASALE